MFEENDTSLRWQRAGGAPGDIGLALGRAGRAAIHERLVGTDYWAAVTDPGHADAVQRMAARTKAQFPDIHDEIAGLAEGLELPFDQVMAWNCRGDLMSNVPDGCTTVQLPGEPPVIAHNEDGLPAFHGDCFIAEIAPDDAPGFLAFCYPGSIPGHTFAVTRAGLAQAVNNIRLRGVAPEIPRMVLGRAVLACTTLDQAVALLSGDNASGGFHFTLAQAGDGRILSVEFGGGKCVVTPVDAPAVHANHALHLDGPEGQTVTRSSAARQERGTALLKAGGRDPLAILRDTGGPDLPIHRTGADDPDCENTLATAILKIGRTGVEWSIYDQTSAEPVHSSKAPWG